MILITVTDVQQAENSKGKFLITVKLSSSAGSVGGACGTHEEVRTFLVFRWFLKTGPLEGVIPVVGDFLGAEKFEALEFAEECSKAAMKAVAFLAYGDNTAKKLTDKLRQKGFSKAAAEAAVNFCVEKGYIREEEQLIRMMEQLCEKKKYGLRRIRQEIYTKGFSEDVVKAVLEDTAAALDFDAALDARIRKIGSCAFSSPEQKKKHVSALIRYGFSYEEISRAMKRLHVGTGADADDEEYFEENE